MIVQRRFDVPFGSDLWISVVMGLMLFVTSLSLLASIGLNQYIQEWTSSAQATFTLELPPKAHPYLEEVTRTLKSYPEIETVTVLDKTYVQKLMFQLGIGASEAPLLIDFVVLKQHLFKFNADKVLADAQKIIPESSLISPVLASPESLSMAKMIEMVSFGFGLLMIIIMCVIITFLMYSEVQTHKRTIELFNLLGAPNYFISKIFQKYASTILLKSFLLSFALNVCFYYGTYLFYLCERTYIIVQELSWFTWAYIVLGIPLLMVAIVQVIVPVTVLRCLKNKYNNSLHP